MICFDMIVKIIFSDIHVIKQYLHMILQPHINILLDYWILTHFHYYLLWTHHVFTSTVCDENWIYFVMSIINWCKIYPSFTEYLHRNLLFLENLSEWICTKWHMKYQTQNEGRYFIRSYYLYSFLPSDQSPPNSEASAFLL